MASSYRKRNDIFIRNVSQSIISTPKQEMNECTNARKATQMSFRESSNIISIVHIAMYGYCNSNYFLSFNLEKKQESFS